MSDLSIVIRKNSQWYAITIFFTGISAFVGIWLTKSNLSPDDFIHFNLQANSISLLNTVILGWFTRGIVRFSHIYHNHFVRRNILLVALSTSLVAGLPLFIAWSFFINIKQELTFPILYLVSNTIYTSFLVGRQASLNGKSATVSEFIRSIILLTALALPYASGTIAAKQYYWISWILSNLIPSIYLYTTSNRVINNFYNRTEDAGTNPPATKTFFQLIGILLKFGLPVSAWLLVSVFLVNADKWYLAKIIENKVLVSNYIAISDIMMRGTGFMFSPLVAAAYPVICRLFDNGEVAEVQKIIVRTIKWQLLLLLGAILGFYIFNELVFSMLKIKNTDNVFLFVGTLSLLFYALWNISAMLQKVAELNLRTKPLFWVISLAAVTSFLFLNILVKPSNLIVVSLCFGTGILLYFSFCIFLFFTLKSNSPKVSAGN